MNNPTQELEQKVCQRYGWSAHFFQTEEGDGCWCVNITLGLDETRTFSSEETSPDKKRGRKAAAVAALAGLEERIRNQECKPKKSLRQVFPQDLDIYQSNKANWDYFWKHKPEMVGIDTEGNQISPPVLVQISTDDYTILETPQQGGSISKDLERLLDDSTIVKVFCDNYSHHDKTSLGIKKVPLDLTKGHIVDIEAIASELLGPVKVARGLGRLVCSSMPELNVQIEKPKLSNGKQKSRMKNVGRFAMIEQGKASPLRNMYDLTHDQQQYAALDAWCTLQVYRRLQEKIMSTR